MAGATDLLICSLPGGYVRENGGLQRDVTIAPLRGNEEELLASKRNRPGAVYVTQILARCIGQIGDINPVTEEIARKLLVADRQYLLLKLREVTFGDRVQASVSCSWPDCGASVDIDFSLNDIPVRESVNKGPVYKMTLSEAAAVADKQGTKHRDIQFRLPNGEDQETISSILLENEAKALSVLLEHCILGIGSVKNPPKELMYLLSPLARMEIEKEMEAVAPEVDMTVGARCPECGREFVIPFDIQDFFFGELKISRDLLYREVHYLAYHYHWSEQEIMAMPREKRRKYVDILIEEMDKQNDSV